MQFRFLPPSPEDERAMRFLQFGTILALMVIGALLPLAWKLGPLQAVLWGAGGALLWKAARAQHELDRKQKRAARGSIQLGKSGLIIADFERADRIFAWEQIKHLVIGPGKLEIHHDQGVETLATREIENSELLISELKRRVQMGSAFDFIALSPM